MPRLFFALLPDDETKQQLQQISNLLKLSSRQKVQPENWHITLVFIGQVNAAQIDTIINQIQPTELSPMTLILNQLDYWHKPEILCLTCSDIELMLLKLVQQLCKPLNELTIKLDSRPYCPHLTLARHIKEQQIIEFNPILWNATQFALMESLNDQYGVIYRPLKNWQLNPL